MFAGHQRQQRASRGPSRHAKGAHCGTVPLTPDVPARSDRRFGAGGSSASQLIDVLRMSPGGMLAPALPVRLDVVSWLVRQDFPIGEEKLIELAKRLHETGTGMRDESLLAPDFR